MLSRAATRGPSGKRFHRSGVRFGFEQDHRGSRVLVTEIWKAQLCNKVLTMISNVAPISHRKNHDRTRNFYDLMSCKTGRMNPPAPPD
jgi:hypothetical protein